MADFSELVGKIIMQIDRDGNDALHFITNDGAFTMQHYQDCCETVEIAEVIGGLDDLVNDGPVLLAEEVSEKDDGDDYESSTWTFYKLRTLNGDVTIRWFGRSNGYYSESVSFDRVTA